MRPTVRELATRLPDLPRLVETRAMLLSGACEVIGDTARGDYVVRSLDAGVAAVVGRPAGALVREAASRGGGIDLLCAEDVANRAAAALPSWRARTAMVHTLSPAAAPRRGVAADVRLVAASDVLPLDHVPAGLREELAAARRRSPFVVAFSDGYAASFAYVAWQTETLCDLSIDTVEPYRRRGLAEAATRRLIAHVAALGKHPVWGALEDNAASLALAARLGFVPVDRLVVLSPAHRRQS